MKDILLILILVGLILSQECDCEEPANTWFKVSTANTKVPSPTVAASPAPAKFAPVTTAGVAPPTIILPLVERSTADIADVESDIISKLD